MTFAARSSQVVVVVASAVCGINAVMYLDAAPGAHADDAERAGGVAAQDSLALFLWEPLGTSAGGVAPIAGP